MLQDTKQNIIDAAIFIFNEDLSAPLEKVAEKADVTRRTLHRYFKDREDLFCCCKQEIQKRCGQAMAQAQQRSADPLEQLEFMLYAAIDCGVKYAFLHKLHHLHNHVHTDKDCKKYDETVNKIEVLLQQLQDKGIVSKQLPAAWMANLMPGIVSTTINSHATGNTDKENLKKFAWFSFSKGIGV